MLGKSLRMWPESGSRVPGAGCRWQDVRATAEDAGWLPRFEPCRKEGSASMTFRERLSNHSAEHRNGLDFAGTLPSMEAELWQRVR